MTINPFQNRTKVVSWIIILINQFVSFYFKQRKILGKHHLILIILDPDIKQLGEPCGNLYNTKSVARKFNNALTYNEIYS